MHLRKKNLHFSSVAEPNPSSRCLINHHPDPEEQKTKIYDPDPQPCLAPTNNLFLLMLRISRIERHTSLNTKSNNYLLTGGVVAGVQ